MDAARELKLLLATDGVDSFGVEGERELAALVTAHGIALPAHHVTPPPPPPPPPRGDPRGHRSVTTAQSSTAVGGRRDGGWQARA
eukprot:COSAG01_NODE_798_length_13503_cov_8.878395_9_plen_85_part_00